MINSYQIAEGRSSVSESTAEEQENTQFADANFDGRVGSLRED